jgi:hypothetical protein
VLLFLGTQHVQSGSGSGFGPSVTEKLRIDGIKVANFHQQISSTNDPLAPIAGDLEKPISVSVREVPSIKRLRFTDAASTQIGMMMAPTYGRFDNLILYPKPYGLAAAQNEINTLGHDAKTALLAAVSKDAVVLVGDTAHPQPASDERPHEKFLSDLMPELKVAGVSDLVVLGVNDAQAQIDEFQKTGDSSSMALPPEMQTVFKSASAAGIRLKAITIPNGQTPAQAINSIADRLQAFQQSEANAKILFVAPARAIAKYPDGQGNDMSVREALANKGVATEAFAAASQDYTAYPLGRVTSILSKPIEFAPSQTKVLQELNNADEHNLGRFDHVILYPDAKENDAPAAQSN